LIDLIGVYYRIGGTTGKASKAGATAGTAPDLLTNVAQFIDKAKQHSGVTELTPKIRRLFIEKIVVGEKSQKDSRTAEQDIWIYYRDIGLMDTPVKQEKAQEAELDEGKAIGRVSCRQPAT